MSGARAAFDTYAKRVHEPPTPMQSPPECVSRRRTLRTVVAPACALSGRPGAPFPTVERFKRPTTLASEKVAWARVVNRLTVWAEAFVRTAARSAEEKQEQTGNQGQQSGPARRFRPPEFRLNLFVTRAEAEIPEEKRHRDPGGRRSKNPPSPSFALAERDDAFILFIASTYPHRRFQKVA